MDSTELSVQSNNLEEIKKSKWKIKKTFYIYCVGLVLTFSAYVSMVALQSSINIVGGLGVISLALAYTTSIFFGVFIVPQMLRKLGCKTLLIFGEVTYLIYVVANFYPKPWVLLTAGIMTGMGEACIWVTLAKIATHFGQLYENQSGLNGEGAYVQKFMSIFFTFLPFGSIFGNLISYLVLYGWKVSLHNDSFNFTIYQPKSYQYCGANDCQDPNVTQSNIDQYVPTAKLSLYVLFSLLTVICVIGIALHVKWLPYVPGYTLDLTMDADKQSMNSYKTLQTLKDTVRHFFTWQQFRLTPLSFFHGFWYGFLYVEFQRSFTSCVRGVEEVGFSMMTFALFDSISANIAGRIRHKVDKNHIMTVSLTAMLAILIFSLLWRPTDSTTWLVYLLFVACGSANGFLRTCILVCYNDYFPENTEIAFAWWNIAATVGMAVMYGFSTEVCIREKLFIAIGLWGFGVLVYGVGEKLEKKQKFKRGVKVAN